MQKDDFLTSSGPGREAAWEARPTEVDAYLANEATGDAHEKLTDTGEQIKDWPLGHGN